MIFAVTVNGRTVTTMKDDTISRAAALDALGERPVVWSDNDDYTLGERNQYDMDRLAIETVPSASFENHDEIKSYSKDTISREAAVEVMRKAKDKSELHRMLLQLPSAQPEHTCVNCGRTANNGGWYADGGTRCPIEEHYALPKDGYCHLWEKRNVTDDDCPERREE